MHLSAELRDARADLRSAWESLSPVHRNAVSEAGRGPWRPIDVLDHLALTLGQVAHLTGRLWSERPAELPESTPTESMRHRLDEYGIVEVRTRIDAPDFALPRGGLAADALWQELDRGLDALTALSDACEHTDVSTLRYPHPVLGLLDLHEWLLFAGQHERRHAHQIRTAGVEAGHG